MKLRLDRSTYEEIKRHEDNPRMNWCPTCGSFKEDESLHCGMDPVYCCSEPMIICDLIHEFELLILADTGLMYGRPTLSSDRGAQHA